LNANGKLAEAQEYSKKALVEGTQDARLFYHAGCIALAAGEYSDAKKSFALCNRIKQMLMPSEREDLGKQYAFLMRREISQPAAVSN
jgi:hypothetical protein